MIDEAFDVRNGYRKRGVTFALIAAAIPRRSNNRRCLQKNCAIALT
jgi:hypothetical protein